MLEFIVLLLVVAMAAAGRALVLSAWSWRSFIADCLYGFLLLVGVRLLTALVGIVGGGGV